MSSEKTRWVFDEEFSEGDLNLSDTDQTFALGQGKKGSFTESIGGNTTSGATEAMGSDNDSTRMLGGFEEADDKTVILSAATEEQVDLDVGFDGSVDPVVGWLVILKGPGKGNSIPLGHGMNLIGRSSSQRIPLPYGDKLISSEDHAKIMYEDREFYIAHGSGKNITKVNGKMVPNMIQLQNHALIQLTKATTLAFVALCGEDFDWSDLNASRGN